MIDNEDDDDNGYLNYRLILNSSKRFTCYLNWTTKMRDNMGTKTYNVFMELTYSNKA